MTTLAPPGAGEVVVRETPTARVFLAGARAYKLKRPLRLPFLDYSTPERRLAACREEVRVNRRLAPDVYLGVRAVVPGPEGPTLADADDPRAVDYVVEMARFDEGRTLRAALAEGRARPSDLVEVARTLAGFHAGAEVHRRGDAAELAAVRGVAEDNFEALAPWAGRLGGERLAAAERFAATFLGAWGPAIARRAREGHVRDGHGDLRAEHVLLRPVEVVDRLEFDPELRRIDAGADLGFLVMDLTRLGHADLAWELVGDYRRAGGDPGADALVAYHGAVRAGVRAKVACLAAGDDPTPALEKAHGYLVAGERLAWRARLPLVLAVGGPPASGKSRLAEALAGHSGLPVLGSDVTRKRLVAVEPEERAPASAYAPEVSRRTYRELGAAAARELAAGGGAIVDATFRRAEHRRAFAEGLGPRGEAVFVECRAPEEVLVMRALRRAAERSGPSDAGPAEALRLSAEWEPLDEVPPDRRLVVDTDRPVDEAAAAVVAGLDRRLAASRPAAG